MTIGLSASGSGWGILSTVSTEGAAESEAGRHAESRHKWRGLTGLLGWVWQAPWEVTFWIFLVVILIGSAIDSWMKSRWLIAATLTAVVVAVPVAVWIRVRASRRGQETR